MSSSQLPQDPNTKPGLIGSHVEYIKGATVGAIGNLTGSQEWKQSGDQTKEHAVHDMKEASQNRVPERDGYGNVEAMAGKVTGCEGMQKEGAASVHKNA